MGATPVLLSLGDERDKVLTKDKTVSTPVKLTVIGGKTSNCEKRRTAGVLRNSPSEYQQGKIHRENDQNDEKIK